MERMLILFTLLNLAIYVFILHAIGKRWNFSQAHRRFFFVILFAIFWILDVLLENIIRGVATVGTYRIVTQLNYFLAPLVAGAVFLFALSLHRVPRWLSIGKEIVIISPLIMVAFASFSNLIIDVSENLELSVHNLYWLYFSVLAIYFVFLTGFVLLSKWKRAKGIQRMQVKYISIGYFLTICVLLTQSLLTNTRGVLTESVDLLVTNGSILFSVLTAIAMIRYRFMDIHVFIQRGTIRLLSLLVVFVVYLLMFAVAIQPLFQNPASVVPATYVVLGLIFLVTVEPLRKYVTGYIDKLFAQHDTNVEKVKQRLEVQLRSQLAYEELQKEIKLALQKVVGVSTIEYYENGSIFTRTHPSTWAFAKLTGKVLVPEEFQYRLDEDEQYALMRDEFLNDSTSAIVPVGQSETFVGCYILGPRNDRGAYSIEDVRTLGNLQLQFTSALLSARLYKLAIDRIGGYE